MGSQVRLQKIIAGAGIVSRRKAETLIREGRVTLNGRIVTEMGAKADPSCDHIKVDGKLVRHSSDKVYVLLNKPRKVICSVADPEGLGEGTGEAAPRGQARLPHRRAHSPY